MARGRFLGMPYDWRRPTRDRLRKKAWDPENPKFFVPKAYGWGYGINWAALFNRHCRRD